LPLLLSKYSGWGVVSLLLLAVIPYYIGVPTPWLEILLSLGTSIFILLTISFYVNEKIKFHTNAEIKQLVHEKFPVLVDMEKQGFINTIYSNNMKENSVDIVNSETLYLVMNDGKNFIANNSGALSERFRKDNKKTVVILLDPESSSQDFLCHKNRKDSGHYKVKVLDAIKSMKNYLDYGSEKHELLVYLYEYPFSLNIVATNECAVIGIYRNSAGNFGAPPSYVYSSKGTEYESIMGDVHRLIENSEKHP
ncbi:hypothetical protein, partial [Vibrio antiquarius]